MPSSSDSTSNCPTWWTAEWGYNDWNEIVTYKVDGTVDEKKMGDGGQKTIFEWTRFTDGVSVNNAIAYGWGCWDSFDKFNEELIEQRTAIRDYRAANSKSETQNKEIDTEYVNLQWSESQTTAPGAENNLNRWKYYLFEENSATNRDGKDKISERNALVSVPALSTYWDDKDQYAAPKHDKYTSGIDCSGFLVISANYIGNDYVLPDLDEKKYESKTVSTSMLVQNTYCYSIFNAGNTNEWKLEEIDTNNKPTDKAKEHQKLLSHAVPGDILVVSDNSYGKHVVIIQNLNFDENYEFITKYSQIDVIHAIPFLKGEQASAHQNIVRKSTWLNIQNNIKYYKLRRLLKNE